MRNSFSVDIAAGRLEPKGRGEVADINIVSNVVVGTHIRATGWRSLPVQKEKHQRSGSGQTELTGWK